MPSFQNRLKSIAFLKVRHQSDNTPSDPIPDSQTYSCISAHAPHFVAGWTIPDGSLNDRSRLPIYHLAPLKFKTG
ncbi:hypothetical protein [Xanthocytophaga agilis]|uniref:Uncharacterized protein n=1 Tax=Xanthocytophaga agilis TaxID=3048010 RepID=A0AAE3UIJ0_9BACT|nr:hypothetical protein [Xanthocytophaga agilis]MDJ1506655.1 hypothetical protein [Xanthocytophaga agilis]